MHRVLPFVPTTRLLLLLLSVAPLLLLGSLYRPLLLLALLGFVLVASVVVVDAMRAPKPAELRITREHEPRLSIGERNAVRVRVDWRAAASGSAPHARTLAVRDEAPPEIPNDGTVFSGTLQPGGVWETTYHLHPRRRGAYTFGALNVRLASPLGLLLRQIRVPIDLPAHVYPNIIALRRYDLLTRRGQRAELGMRRTRRIGEGTEFERLREYQPDDDFRRINWKATARRGVPMTIEHEIERSQHLMLAIDAGRLMGTPAGDLQKGDHAINAALLLAWVSQQLGDKVGLLVFTDRVEHYIAPNRGQRHFRHLLETLYRIEMQPVESDPVRALQELAHRQQRRSLIVTFTDIAESIEPGALIGALTMLRRRHLPLCVLVANPDTERMAHHTPDSLQATYEKVIATRLLDERRAITDAFERRGTLVLDVPAENLSGALVNRYLEIKARTHL